MNSELFNLSFYRFLRLGSSSDLLALRTELREVCKELDLRGTLLIASEGVNAMVSGTEEAILRFQDIARVKFGIEEKVFKITKVPEHSFARMLVKIKTEIIPVGDPTLRPDQHTATRISPQELKEWLDQGRSITLLDTRNDYEIEVGTFKGAQNLGLQSSRDFTARAAQNLETWRDRPVVTFCTGGIRCEKASAVLLNLGLKDVYQLDGGILRYFAENGAAHFDGSCFVFDWRLAVDGELRPSARAADEEREFGRHQKRKR